MYYILTFIHHLLFVRHQSAIITGMYPTTLGTHNMRAYNEGRKSNQPQLNIPSYSPKFPTKIKPFTIALRNAGYYCINSGKEDYNFKISKDAWDKTCSYCQRKRKSCYSLAIQR